MPSRIVFADGADSTSVPSSCFDLRFSSSSLCWFDDSLNKYVVARAGAAGRDDVQVTRLYDSSGNVVLEVNGSGGVEVGSPSGTAGAGDVVVGGDITAEGDIVYKDSSVGLNRACGFASTSFTFTDPTDHFSATPSSPWAWASDTGIFNGTPTVAIVNDTYLRVTGSGANGYFLYQNVTGSTSYRVFSKMSIGTSAYFAGVRIDDGSNSNYVETRLLPGTTGYKLSRRDSHAGEVFYYDNMVPQEITLMAAYIGSDGSLRVRTRILLNSGIEVSLLDNATFTFTPARIGLICRPGATSSAYYCLFDWIHFYNN